MISCHFVGLVEAVQLNEQFISVKTGENATLSCKVEKSDTHVKVWYKQQLWQKPKEVVSKLDEKPPYILNGSKFSNNKNFDLSLTLGTINTMPCLISIKCSFKHLLYSPGHPQLNISVLQSPVRGSVSPGESVTLQCTVLSEIRAADLRVLWFRAAAGQSFPEIIYTHQNSSSRQCEISFSTSCSLYEFSKNILDQHHTGTYYCPVAACGRIIVGNGASVELMVFLFSRFMFKMPLYTSESMIPSMNTALLKFSYRLLPHTHTYIYIYIYVYIYAKSGLL
uniref:Ig-like domain-containing protein n=1 Tax=Pygocentrus nattereri TaxID=42514 RepID=A0A3B4BN66_PYGNA